MEEALIHEELLTDHLKREHGVGRVTGGSEAALRGFSRDDKRRRLSAIRGDCTICHQPGHYARECTAINREANQLENLKHYMTPQKSVPFKDMRQACPSLCAQLVKEDKNRTGKIGMLQRYLRITDSARAA